MGLEIAELRVAGGALGLCPLPGVDGDFHQDFRALLDWAPGIVVSMTEPQEMAAAGAEGVAEALATKGIEWVHLPIRDFGAPGPEVRARWPEGSQKVRAALAAGGRVLVHCRGGCGRSGMMVLRLMVEAGEAPEAALGRLRAVRPCAVETEAQMAWAVSGAVR